MRLMHTKLPDFYEKLENAAKRHTGETEFSITGLENMKTGKLASSAIGMMEEDIYNMTLDESLEKVEVTILPQFPETLHTVVIKGIQKDGTSKKAFLHTAYVSAPSHEYYDHDSEEIIDKRIKLV